MANQSITISTVNSVSVNSLKRKKKKKGRRKERNKNGKKRDSRIRINVKREKSDALGDYIPMIFWIIIFTYGEGNVG